MDFFKSKSKREKETAIKNLILVMAADGTFDNTERAFLEKISREKYGLDKNDVSKIFDNFKNIEFVAPKDPQEKFNQLVDMVYMMIMDGKVDRREMDACISLGVRLGFRPSAVPEILQHIISKFQQKENPANQVNVDLEKWIAS